MKKVFKNVSFVFLLLKMCFIFGQETAPQKRIVIDVGHGGKDSGAIGINGIKEKDVVLNIALEVLRLNKKSKTPLNIFLTRYNDTLISLSDRTKLANTLDTDVFISLHCNHSDNANARGIEVYVANTKSQFSGLSTLLAYLLQAYFKKELGFESRGVKFANFQVLRENVDYRPAVLVEVGFLTNEDEGFYFLQPSKVKAVAMAILKGIYNYSNKRL
ncbi:N-acetylmuramoyl-L-alanine amidase family protein [Galbibacter pacificus]|uniref:N-acetylmuramoyl-L-alanine amidase n=1 Tax=Galbibacter pacificus TaxID=2996052 RepID=A0ABT6FNP8_9FLAO|nr:N-acetylmuramoyl-L-alanine amidase [Galbibacter pacificus]MDG3581418.1 N-acetylmuramoyl-L-alanine amidase [Galbibacter pacificus]MDG3584896.1 N-acetylmuramoyl-L-alanine amidase [Galbibacter pacificus]